MSIRSENVRMVGKLAVVAGMFAFGYALVPMYKAICEMTGINILSIVGAPGARQRCHGRDASVPANTQIDPAAPSRWSLTPTPAARGSSSPRSRSVQVHPGQLTTVMYEFQNVQNRTHGCAGHSQLCAQPGGSAFQQA
jgi:cytochrome c oxidase assembly protein subunit 11